MYNYHSHQRSLRVNASIKQLIRKQQLQDRASQRKMQQLVHNHQKRIDHYILSMIEKPKIITIYKNRSMVLRNQDKSKRVVEGDMKFQYQDQFKKVARSLRNQNYDVVPFNNSSMHSFRPRLSVKANILNKSMEIRQSSKQNYLKKNAKPTVSEVLQLYAKSAKTRKPKTPKNYFRTIETIANNQINPHIRYETQEQEQNKNQIHILNRPNQALLKIKRVKNNRHQQCRRVLQNCGLVNHVSEPVSSRNQKI